MSRTVATLSKESNTETNISKTELNSSSGRDSDEINLSQTANNEKQPSLILGMILIKPQDHKILLKIVTTGNLRR